MIFITIIRKLYLLTYFKMFLGGSTHQDNNYNNLRYKKNTSVYIFFSMEYYCFCTLVYQVSISILGDAIIWYLDVSDFSISKYVGICVMGDVEILLPALCTLWSSIKLIACLFCVGVHIINLRHTWEKLLLAARVIAAIEPHSEVFVISSKTFGQKAVLKFATHTGATPIAGRFTPGAFTNQIQVMHLYSSARNTLWLTL